MAKKKEQIQRHIKTHTPRSDDDRNAVTMLSAFLRSDGKIAHNGFACNDTYPNIDGNFELVPNPEISRRPKQNFSVQIKGTSIENINADQEIKKEMDFWTFDEFQKFISVIENDETYKTFFEALYVTGCRRGEMLAIGRNDIDENANILSISKSITIRADGAPWKITTPKNKYSVRKIYIPHSLAVRMVALEEKHHGTFVFGGDEPLRPTSIDRNMRKYVDKAGVKRIRVHDLRHSCASYLISKGVSILAVSKRLGHATTQQTLNTYSHMMPSDQQYLEGILNEMQI